jgi:predicted glycosyltransferase
VIVTGPFMPEAERARLARAAGERDDLHVLGFVPDADALVAIADDVVAMGGYNTACEILAAGTRALIVPRVRPRREQLVRAQALAARGAVDVLHPDRLSADALSAWLAAGGARRPVVDPPIDRGGLERLPAMLDEVLAAGPGRGARDRRFERRAVAGGTSMARSASA